ncbi:hypothetical protein [Chitinimonas koreensis]|uniref:hypothetical protein n=1 Tax=Chitinimonas koreensis TaxID=356302 RepID=UPI0012FA05D5|nr:hypothetical protein [Chitinimonas koreensis]
MQIVTRIKHAALPLVDLSPFDAVGISSPGGEDFYVEIRPERWAMKFFSANAGCTGEVQLLIIEVEQPDDALTFMDIAGKVDQMVANQCR